MCIPLHCKNPDCHRRFHFATSPAKKYTWITINSFIHHDINRPLQRLSPPDKRTCGSDGQHRKIKSFCRPCIELHGYIGWLLWRSSGHLRWRAGTLWVLLLLPIRRGEAHECINQRALLASNRSREQNVSGYRLLVGGRDPDMAASPGLSLHQLDVNRYDGSQDIRQSKWVCPHLHISPR